MTATLLNSTIGWSALIGGFVIGSIGTQLYYVPRLREKWNRVGVPGQEKTQEQLKTAELEKRKGNQNIALIVIVGIIVSALWRTILPAQIQNVTLVTLIGGIVGSLLRILWLIYQEGGKLKQS